MANLSSLLVEKYRPKTLDDVVFQNSQHREKFKGFVSSGEIPMILLYGIQGVGKSSIVRALLHDMRFPKADVLFINASRTNGIDVVRNEIEDFSTSQPRKANYRIIILEEFDKFTEDAQLALRVPMEMYQRNVRFIMTCNYENRIIPPISSRITEKIYMSKPDEGETLMRLFSILEQEQVTFNEEDVAKILVAYYPDIRSMIQKLQASITSDKRLVLNDVSGGDAQDWKILVSDCFAELDFDSLRGIVSSMIPRESFADFYRIGYSSVKNCKKLSQEVMESIILTLAEYDYRNLSVALPDLNAEACVIQIKRVIK